MTTFLHMVGYMDRASSKGNEAKSKMKQPLDMPHRDSNTGSSDMWSNTLPLDHGGAPGAGDAKLCRLITEWRWDPVVDKLEKSYSEIKYLILMYY